MFKRYLFLFLLSLSSIFSDSLDSLLKEYEKTTQESLYTIDEKLGNVTVYSQKEIRLMQYKTLSDLLKEFPLSNLNKNRFGSVNLSLSGSKTDLSGFFRLFINDHEVSSSYTMSPSASWLKFPMDIVDYVEIYRGNSSFSLGSSDGVFFIRVYTKQSSKNNSSGFYTSLSDDGSNSQAISHSELFESGWSYLAYASDSFEEDHNSYKSNVLNNHLDLNHVYLNIQKQDTSINFGYSYMDTQSFTGLSLDVNPDKSLYRTDDGFIDFTTLLLDDKSLKVNLSLDLSKHKYSEENKEGLAVISVIDFRARPVFPTEYLNNSRVFKTKMMISKEFKNGSNNLLIGLDSHYKDYQINKKLNFNPSGYDQEKKYSAFIQDDYRLHENMLFVLNLKYDYFQRDNNLGSEDNMHYRVGAIFTPMKNFGIKTFYNKTSIVPSFYSVDNKSQFSDELKTQKYSFYDLEAVYANDDLRVSFLYNKTEIDDFIYYAPIGFINIEHTVKADNYILDIKYSLFKDHEISANIFKTKLSEEINNSNKGGLLKYIGSIGNIEYFSSLIYRGGYSFYDLEIDDSYNLNLGLSYYYNKDISLSLKAENILDDSTNSLYKEGLNQDPSIGNFALEDYEPKITFTTKWVF